MKLFFRVMNIAFLYDIIGNYVVHSQLHSDRNIYILYRSKRHCYIDQFQLVTHVL